MSLKKQANRIYKSETRFEIFLQTKLLYYNIGNSSKLSYLKSKHSAHTMSTVLVFVI